MVAPASGHVQGAEDFFILNVAAGHRQFLCAETKFTQFAGDRVTRQFRVMLVNDCLLAAEEGGVDDFSALDCLQAKRAVGVLHDESALASSRDEVHFAGREVSHVWLVDETDAMAFLRLLFAALEIEGVGVVAVLEIDFEMIGPGQGEAQFLRVLADLVIIYS